MLALTTHESYICFNKGLVPTGTGYAEKFAGQYVKAMFEHGPQIEAIDPILIMMPFPGKHCGSSLSLCLILDTLLISKLFTPFVPICSYLL